MRDHPQRHYDQYGSDLISQIAPILVLRPGFNNEAASFAIEAIANAPINDLLPVLEAILRQDDQGWSKREDLQSVSRRTMAAEVLSKVTRPGDRKLAATFEAFVSGHQSIRSTSMC